MAIIHASVRDKMLYLVYKDNNHASFLEYMDDLSDLYSPKDKTQKGDNLLSLYLDINQIIEISSPSHLIKLEKLIDEGYKFQSTQLDSDVWNTLIYNLDKNGKISLLSNIEFNKGENPFIKILSIPVFDKKYLYDTFYDKKQISVINDKNLASIIFNGQCRIYGNKTKQVYFDSLDYILKDLIDKNIITVEYMRYLMSDNGKLLFRKSYEEGFSTVSNNLIYKIDEDISGNTKSVNENWNALVVNVEKHILNKVMEESSSTVSSSNVKSVNRKRM